MSGIKMRAEMGECTPQRPAKMLLFADQQNRKRREVSAVRAKVPRIKQVATLAESQRATTCSALIARQHHYGIVPSGSFEEAIALVKKGVAEGALVPGAYPKIGAFFMDPMLRLVRCFAAEIPALVMAAKPNALATFREVHAHPATRPFWGEATAPVIEASSNDAAADAVVDTGIACITNAAAAKRCNLKILHVFREASPMSWNLFVLAPATTKASA